MCCTRARRGFTALAEALVLPFGDADTVRYLSVLAETVGVTPPFLVNDGSADLFFLAPAYPALRALSVRDAARAWVLVDMLCLNVARVLEEDLVQRYAENPSAEADWRGALTVDGWSRRSTLQSPRDG